MSVVFNDKAINVLNCYDNDGKGDNRLLESLLNVLPIPVVLAGI